MTDSLLNYRGEQVAGIEVVSASSTVPAAELAKRLFNEGWLWAQITNSVGEVVGEVVPSWDGYERHHWGSQ